MFKMWRRKMSEESSEHDKEVRDYIKDKQGERQDE
jgi:hypothetical protein